MQAQGGVLTIFSNFQTSEFSSSLGIFLRDRLLYTNPEEKNITMPTNMSLISQRGRYEVQNAKTK